MNRRTLSAMVALAVVVASSVVAQDRALQAYQDRFRDAGPAGKLQTLQTADRLTAEELGPLYVQAVQHVLTNSEDIAESQILQDIAAEAIDGIEEGQFEPAARVLWTLFDEFEGNTLRIRILEVLRDIAPGNAEVILDLNGWVQAQANLYRGGVAPDQQVMRNAVITLGSLADDSSFSVLLDVQLVGMTDVITRDARAAMEQLPGDYAELAHRTINERQIARRLEALDYFLEDEELSDQQRAEIAFRVLNRAVREVTRDPNQIEAKRQVRYRAAQTFADIPYPDATEALVLHFEQTFADYEQGRTTKTWVLESIAALGTTGSERAAVRLTAFLDLLNIYAENDRPYDTQLMLAVVTNLGRLGYEVAYDALFYVDLLNYSRRVKAAAREALDQVSQ
ncbi:MAG: hypothetical protein ACLFNT_00230 [Spirochaetales bacterium]